MWGQEREKWGIAGLGWSEAVGKSSHSRPTFLVKEAALGSSWERGESTGSSKAPGSDPRRPGSGSQTLPFCSCCTEWPGLLRPHPHGPTAKATASLPSSLPPSDGFFAFFTGPWPGQLQETRSLVHGSGAQETEGEAGAHHAQKLPASGLLV